MRAFLRQLDPEWASGPGRGRAPHDRIPRALRSVGRRRRRLGGSGSGLRTDGGRTWGEPRAYFTPRVGARPGRGGHPPSMVGRHPHPGVDLAEKSGADAVVAGTSDLDVGLFVDCAGADPYFVPFLDARSRRPRPGGRQLPRSAAAVPSLRPGHGRAWARGDRPGLLRSRSGRARRMVAYGASKAFDLVMGEALWAELHEHGVDVLSLVLGLTDMPALCGLLADRGNWPAPTTARRFRRATSTKSSTRRWPTWRTVRRTSSARRSVKARRCSGPWPGTTRPRRCWIRARACWTRS